jgi:glucose/mannose transport system permease protein
MAIGLLLAILLDQKIRAEGVLRTIYLYPMALSFIVTGTAWKWILNPGLGLEKVMHDWGWTSFSFDWLVDPDRPSTPSSSPASGRARLRDGAVPRRPARHRRLHHQGRADRRRQPAAHLLAHHHPSLRPVFFSTLMVLSHLAIKSFDLVMALTAGGPGYATDLPATFMYTMAFTRGQIGLGAASATMMLATVAAIVVPYLYSELRSRHERRTAGRLWALPLELLPVLPAAVRDADLAQGHGRRSAGPALAATAPASPWAKAWSTPAPASTAAA